MTDRTPTSLDYFDKRGRHRTPSLASERAAHKHLLHNAGDKSRGLLGAVRLAAWADWFCEGQAGRGCGERTVAQDLSRYRRHLWEPLGDPAVADVSVEDLEALARDWQCSLATKRDRSYAVIRLFEAAWGEGAVAANVASIALRPWTRHAEHVTRRVADARDVDTILAASSPRLRLALNLAMDAHLCEAELAALCFTDIEDLCRVTVRFRLERGEEVQQPRPSKERTVELTAETGRLLRAWRDRPDRPVGCPYVFPSATGGRLSYPVLIHLRRLQYRIGMRLLEPRRPVRRQAMVKNKRKPNQLFLERWTLGEITDLRVVEWYADKENPVSKKEILERCGWKSVSRLDRFDPWFDRIDRGREAFDAVDGLLDGARE